MPPSCCDFFFLNSCFTSYILVLILPGDPDQAKNTRAHEVKGNLISPSLQEKPVASESTALPKPVPPKMGLILSEQDMGHNNRIKLDLREVRICNKPLASKTL